MQETVSSDEDGLRPCQFYKEYIQTDQRTQKYILTPWHPVQRLKLKKEKNLLHKKSPRKRKGNQQKRQMYTQILSKNELVINTEEQKGEEEERRKRKAKNNNTRMDMVNTEKRKEKQQVQELLNYQPVPLAFSKKRNKCEAKNQRKQPREK